MRRETARDELENALRAAGAFSGRIELPALWPVLAAWWRSPVADVAPEDDERAFRLSVAPASAHPNATVFAGQPPAAIAGVELVCLEFERRFTRTTESRREGLDGGAGVVWWYEWDRAWQELRRRSDWIGMGVSTPELDEVADGRRVESLIGFIETESGALEVTARRAARALVLVGDGR